MGHPIDDEQIAAWVAQVRDHVDRVTPDIPRKLNRADVGELAMCVGFDMAAACLRMTAEHDEHIRLGFADLMADIAAKMRVSP